MSTSAQKLQYEHVWIGDQRMYLIDGVVRPGVTSVLSATGDNSWKTAWLARHGEEECQRRTELGCNRGTLVHWMIEDYFGEARDARPVFERNAPDPDVVEAMLSSVKPVLDNLKPLDIEVTLQWSCDSPSIGRGFAGLADFVGEITTGAHAGTMVLADWKTSKYVPMNLTSDKLVGYRMQLAAYRAALRQCDPERYADLNRALIVAIGERGGVQLVPVGAKELLAAELGFASRLARYYQHHWSSEAALELEASKAA